MADEMSVLSEALPGSQIGLTIEIPKERVDAAFERVLERLSQRVKIEGFRPGRAPRALVEARIGQAALRDEVIDNLVPSVVGEAIRDQSIDAIDRPRVDVVQLERGLPARLTAKVSVMPEVNLPDLSQLAVERSRTTVTDEMVEARLQELREGLAEITPVEREVQVGDVVVADLEVEVDGHLVPSETRGATEVEVKEGVLIPELLAALPGKRLDEAAEVDVTLPQEHSDPALAGRPAHLRMTVKGVKEKRLPEADDELAKRLSEGEQETMAGLREAIHKDLVAAAARVDDLAYEQAVLKAVVDGAQLEVPEALVQHEVEHEAEDLQRRLSQQGLRLDRYLAYLGLSSEQWLDKTRPEAESRLRVDMVLEEVSRKLSVEPSEEEISDYLRQEVAQDPELKGRVEEVSGSRAIRDYFTHRLRRLQTLRRLVELAEGKGGIEPAEVSEASDRRGDRDADQGAEQHAELDAELDAEQASEASGE